MYSWPDCPLSKLSILNCFTQIRRGLRAKGSPHPPRSSNWRARCTLEMVSQIEHEYRFKPGTHSN
jgi:hypothetical protein